MAIDILTLAAARAGGSGGSGGSASKYKQPDWGSEFAEVEILPQTSFNSDSEVSLGGLFVIKYPTSNRLEAGKEYVVEFNGKKYVLTAWEHHHTIPTNPPVEMTFTVLGNGMVANVEGVETNIPFGIVQGENHENKDGQLKTFDGSTNVTISIKAVEETIHKLPSKYVEGAAGGKYKQPEWGAETAIVDILPETELTILEEVGAAMVMQEVTLTEGNVYTVNYNGTEYACTTISNGDANLLLGNAGAIDETFPVTDEPFIFMTIPKEQRDQYMGAYAIAMPLDGTTSFTLFIRGEVETVYKIPSKYVDDHAPIILEYGTDGKVPMTSGEIITAIKAGRQVYLDHLIDSAFYTFDSINDHGTPKFRYTALDHVYYATVDYRGYVTITKYSIYKSNG